LEPIKDYLRDKDRELRWDGLTEGQKKTGVVMIVAQYGMAKRLLVV